MSTRCFSYRDKNRVCQYLYFEADRARLLIDAQLYRLGQFLYAEDEAARAFDRFLLWRLEK